MAHPLPIRGQPQRLRVETEATEGIRTGIAGVLATWRRVLQARHHAAPASDRIVLIATSTISLTAGARDFPSPALERSGRTPVPGRGPALRPSIQRIGVRTVPKEPAPSHSQGAGGG
jgi:hypothetical protein